MKRMWRKLVLLIRALFARDRFEREIDDELALHLALETEANLARGMSAEEARRRARMSFGSVDATAESIRQVRGLGWFDGVRRELPLAARSLRRSPGFALAATAVLALGIGAATAGVGVADAVVFDALPYERGDRLFSVYEQNEPDIPSCRGTTCERIRAPSWPTVQDWSRDLRSVEGLAYVRGEGLGVHGEDGTMLLLAAYTGANLFSTLGVAPVMGRLFDVDESDSGAPVVVLGWHTWRNEFGGDPNIIGRTLSTENGPLEVIGVLREGVRYPMWAHMWVPLGVLMGSARVAVERRDLHVDAQTVARLADSVNPDVAAAELGAISERLAEVHPDLNGWTGVALRSVRAELLGSAPSRVVVLGIGVALLLLVGCANVAGLLVARSMSRRRELAVRAALGASRGRVAGPLAAEAVLLALAGGLLGLLIAVVLLRALGAVAPDALPRIASASVGAVPLAFAVGASVFTAFLFGVLPARRAAKVAPMEALRAATASAGRVEERMRSTLVVTEIALAIVLLVGAVALVQVFARLSAIDVGVDVDGVVTVRVEPPKPRYASAASAAALYDAMESAVRAVPGVSSVALVNHLPLSGTSMITSVQSGRPLAEGERPMALFRLVSADYFETLGIAVKDGRTLTPAEVATTAPVALVNESLAAQEWPGRDAVGRTMTIVKVAQGRADFGETVTVTVVGVVADTRTFGPGSPAPAAVYLPYTLTTWPNMFVVARGSLDANRLVDPVRRALLELDATLPIAGPGFSNHVRPFAEYAGNWIRAERASAALLGGFAVSAFLLAIVGLFGVVAYLVVQRKREISVRLAIGATPSTIIRLVVSQAARLALIGITVGTTAAATLSLLIRSQNDTMPRANPSAYALAAIMFLVAAVCAAWLPATKAARLKAAVVLREEQ